MDPVEARRPARCAAWGMSGAAEHQRMAALQFFGIEVGHENDFSRNWMPRSVFFFLQRLIPQKRLSSPWPSLYVPDKIDNPIFLSLESHSLINLIATIGVVSIQRLPSFLVRVRCMLPGFTSSLPAPRRAGAKGRLCPLAATFAMPTRGSPPARDTEGLSAYERERNKNVQQNRQVPSP